MKTMTSISGGQSSAYIAANYPSDINIFALVRVEDPECLWMKGKDEPTRRLIEDRIQKPFIGTAEDDMIIYTILDLEQHLGREINIVSGETFDEILRLSGGYLPNIVSRFCTSKLKIEPMFYWWAEHVGEPVEMQIGYRANETRRVETMAGKLNENGLLTFEATFEKHESGRHKGNNKWEMIEWQKPTFPMVQDGIYRDKVVEYWRGKGVRFAWKNNCAHCFHQNPMTLRKRYELDPEKMLWAAKQEIGKNGFWRSDVSYQQIIDHELQTEMNLDDFDDECDSGHCSI